MPPNIVCFSRNRCTSVETIDDTISSVELDVAVRVSDREILDIQGKWHRWTTLECPRATQFLGEAVGSRIGEVGPGKSALPARRHCQDPQREGNGEKERIRLGGGPRLGASNRLLLGVTGGIATGKTTVSRMLEELGAATIDFDVLARQVVEPGKPAYEQIVAFFGKQVLQEDGTIDRKKLSDIVFQDMEKRKKLESFTHPQIGLEFLNQVNEITAADPNAIIQVAVPLLLEVNLQHLFHKILLVYTPRETQVQRLVARDGISEQEAARILDAQWPIDDKVGFADFVVNNEKGLDETRKQVEDLWKNLKKIQEERKTKKPSS